MGTAEGTVEGTVEPDLRHHGDREVGAGLVDLAVNVRRPAPPDWLRERLVRALDDVARYPDATAATAAVASRHGRAVDQVLVTAGAAEAFTLLARGLRPGRQVCRAMVVHPQFTEPEVALSTAGHRVERLLLRADDGFRFDPAAVPDDVDLLVVGNPTNPTSVLHPAATLRAVLRPGRVVVVDEAFMDAVPGESQSLAGPLGQSDSGSLVVVRSLTKTWGLAGLRAGYLLGPPDIVRRLAAVQPPWSVSTLALEATVACCEPTAVAQASATAQEMVGDREHLRGRLTDLGVRVVAPARAPFLLVHLPAADQHRIALRARGFALRRGDTFPGLGPQWLRIAVRDRATTDALATALAEVLAEAMSEGARR